MRQLLVFLPFAGLLWACPAAEQAAPSPPAAAPPAAVPPAPAAPTGTGLADGAPVPQLSLLLQDGQHFELPAPADQLVLVYFYPKDDTPGCTIEAQGLRDTFPELAAAGVRVLGVSTQDAASHQAFIEKHSLPFPLVVDDGKVAEAFGVPLRNGLAARQSFLLKGPKVLKAWPAVIPANHAAEVLAAAKSAGPPSPSP
ncbi:MAG: peroxiredoxin [Deltaproteobacteria bacterium]|nr:peroxiredoxin [Deltaproteobacteria bacterium]